MKRLIFLVPTALLIFSCFNANAQFPIKLPVKLPGKSGGITEGEAGQGVKEALEQGLVKAVLQLNKEDGFCKDAFYKILLPPDAKKIEKTLRDVGIGKTVDKAIPWMTRCTQAAAGHGKPSFLAPVK